MYYIKLLGDMKTSGVWKIHHLYQTKKEKKQVRKPTGCSLVPTQPPLELLRSRGYALLRLPGFQLASLEFLGGCFFHP